MLVIFSICTIAFLIGSCCGKILAARGITADFSLQKYHNKILFLLISCFTIVLLLYSLSLLNIIHQVLFFIPTMGILYIQAYPYKFILTLGFLILGLLLFLEISDRTSRKRKKKSYLIIGILSIPLMVLLNFCLPVTNSLNQPKVIDRIIVLQTSPYTCAPASIATLARFTGKHPYLSELDAVKLTMTNRFGTSTLAEIQAMEQLGLKPSFRYGLSLKDLLKIDRPAILHVRVKLKYSGRIVAHAVALLSIDREDLALIVADPLSGIKKIPFNKLKGYWFGEAVFAKP